MHGIGRDRKVGTIVASLAAVAARHRVAVVVVEQLSRACMYRDDHRPRLTEMNHSEQLLAHAEAVVMLHRDEYFAPLPRDSRRYGRPPHPEPVPGGLLPRVGLPASAT